MTRTCKIPAQIVFSFCTLFCLSFLFVFSQQKANAINGAPVLNPISAKSVNENQLLQFGVSATDPDGTVPTLSAVSLPPGATFEDSLNGAGSFGWTPSFTQAGSYNVIFIASDGTLTDSEVVVITVNNVNRPPVLSGIGNKVVNEGQWLFFYIRATDPDLTTPALSALSMPSGTSFIDSLNGTGWFYWSPTFSQAGSYNVTFIATDGSLADSEVVVITVNNVNRPPILAAIGSKLVTEGQLFEFRVSASDADSTVPNHSAINVPSGAVFVDSLNGAGSFQWIPSFTEGGIYDVTFIASDGALADSEVVTITVNESDNEAPILTSIGDRSTTENQLLAFDISASDPNSTTPSLMAEGLPVGATFVDFLNGRGQFAWTPFYAQAGTYNVTFIAKDAVLADSEVVTVTVLESYGSILFAPKVDYGTGEHPLSVFAADLDGDNKPDLAVANGGYTVSVLKNNGDGTFAPRVDYGAGNSPFSVFAANLDGDGNPDLAVANYLGNTVSVFKNNGDGTFAPKVDYGTGSGPLSVFGADFNGDGKPDLAVANYFASTVSVLKNNGNGTFAPKVDYATGSVPRSVFAADLNEDGRPDLAVANNEGFSVSVLMNSGSGTFAPKVDYGAGSRPHSVFAADLNGDGKPDLAVANDYGNSVSVLRNNGDGTFATKVDYGTSVAPLSVFAADLDVNGGPDLISAHGGSSGVSVLRNNGDGTFVSYVGFETGGGSFSVSAADFDSDGDFDLAVTNFDSNTVSILKNLFTCAAAKGDMNGDGNITTADVVSEINCVFLQTGKCDFCFADLNCNGNLTASDVVLILNFVFLGSPLPC